MRFAGSSSWQVRIDTPHALLIGLFVRDAAGLRPRTDLDVPRLVPAVDVREGPAPSVGTQASEQWARWWRRQLLQQDSGDRGFFRPDARFGDGSELGALTREYFDDAVRWSSDRKRERADARNRAHRRGIERDLVRTVEEELGRKAHPFELLVTELPVDGAVGRHVARGHVVVSQALRADPMAYREWLTPVIRGLA